MLVAKEIMTPTVVHLDRQATVQDASAVMTREGVGSIIVTAADFPVGIITETDIVRFMSAGKNPHSVKVEEIMTSPLFSTSVDSDVFQIANTMAANKIKKMPVIEHQRVVGMITQTDIVRCALRAISDLQQQYRSGQIGAQELANRSQEIFVRVPNIVDATKQWHMRCLNCGLRFLSEEKDGQLTVRECPRCQGEIEYDPSPPI